MTKGLLKFLGVLALFLAVGVYFDIPLVIAGLVGFAIGAAVFALDWYQGKTKVYTRNQLAAKPFNGKLPSEVGMATMTAIALAGNDEYKQRLAGEARYAENFEDLLQYAGVSDGTVLEIQAALVTEPANPDSHHAVAVTAGGVVLGYVPEFESESLYNFLLQHRGMARVNSNVHFDCANQASFVELDLERPYRVVPGV
ncbi:MAG: hypothetical protein RL508_404 [Actinomycetota bacterium]|jgi:hypothetical protein